jgi:GntR family transcriptional regulator
MDQFPPLLRFDRDGPGPAYKRLARTVADAIHAGELASGAPLPTERWLSQALGLSRVTVRAAYRALVEDGLLETRAGSGNYVRAGRPPFEQPLWRLSSFSDDMAARGRKAASRLVELTRVEATAAESAALSLAPGDRIVRLTRLRLVDDMALGLEVASLPEDLVGEAALGVGSLYTALADRDLAPARGLQRMRAVSLEPEIAALLGTAPGDAAMLIERMSFLRDGRPIEYTRSHYRGDAYDFVARLDSGDLR